MNAGQEADESLSILRGDQCHAQLYRLFIRCPRSHLEREGAVADLPGLLPDCKAQRKSPGQIIGVCARLVVSNSCDPLDCSPTGSFVHGTFQAGILEWVAISYSRGSCRPRDGTPISCVSCAGGSCFTTAPPGKRRPQVQPLRTGSLLLLPVAGGLHPLGSLRGGPGTEASRLNGNQSTERASCQVWGWWPWDRVIGSR